MKYLSFTNPILITCLSLYHENIIRRSGWQRKSLYIVYYLIKAGINLFITEYEACCIIDIDLSITNDCFLFVYAIYNGGCESIYQVIWLVACNHPKLPPFTNAIYMIAITIYYIPIIFLARYTIFIAPYMYTM